MAKKQIVVGFDVEADSPISVFELTDRQLHEKALYDDNAVIYDDIQDFFGDMNADLVDTENKYWFYITID